MHEVLGSQFESSFGDPETERTEEIRRLSKDLWRDFYQTFRLSWGETAIQPPLFTLLAEEHQRAGQAVVVTIE